MGTGHSGDIDLFTSGDPRFIYAARRDGSGLVLLPDGQAEQLRQLARAHLRCPVRHCPAPELTTVGGERRHHFRHLVRDVATDHGAETWYHLEAKQVLAAWAARQHVGAVVEDEKVLGSRDRIADVFVTLTSGLRYAIEVQFSSLSPELFRERHRWYRDAGITDVWLFIHAGVHLRSGWNDTRNVTYSPTHRAVRESGTPVLWVNPQQQMIGYATRTVNLGNRTYRTHSDDGGDFAVEPLENFHLGPTGMMSAVLADIDVDTAAANEAMGRTERARLDAEEQWRQEVARRARDARLTEARVRLDPGERAKQRSAIIARWESSPQGEAAHAHFGGLMLPLWLLDDGDLDVTIPGRVWKWRLVREVVLPLRADQYLTSSVLMRELELTYRGVFPVKATEREITSMLRELEVEGLLTRVANQPGYYTAVPAAGDGSTQERDVPDGGCPVCHLPLAKDVPGMTIHFGECERRAASRTAR